MNMDVELGDAQEVGFRVATRHGRNARHAGDDHGRYNEAPEWRGLHVIPQKNT